MFHFRIFSPVSEGDVQDRPILGEVDLLSSEHGVSGGLDAAAFGLKLINRWNNRKWNYELFWSYEFQEQSKGLIVDAVLGEIQKKVAIVRSGQFSAEMGRKTILKHSYPPSGSAFTVSHCEDFPDFWTTGKVWGAHREGLRAIPSLGTRFTQTSHCEGLDKPSHKLGLEHHLIMWCNFPNLSEGSLELGNRLVKSTHFCA